MNSRSNQSPGSSSIEPEPRVPPPLPTETNIDQTPHRPPPPVIPNAPIYSASQQLDTTSSPTSQTPWFVALVAGIVAMAVGLGSYLILDADSSEVASGSNGQESQVGNNEQASPPTTVAASIIAPTTARTSVSEVSPTTITGESTTSQVTNNDPRPARLNANWAKVRAAPGVDAAVVQEFRDQNGLALTVGPVGANGWYPVFLDGEVGYIFGAFVVPGDPGYWPAEVRDDRPNIEIFDADGALLTISSSGNKVLVTSQVNDRYEVLTPEGQIGFLSKDDVDLVN